LTSPDQTTNWVTDYDITRALNTIYVYRTIDGRYGKLRVNNFNWWTGGQTIHGIYISPCRTGGIYYDFVTFAP
ncbi:MAG: hypothetical protein P8130_13105, partial [Deltaproteobacteria bacterium]